MTGFVEEGEDPEAEGWEAEGRAEEEEALLPHAVAASQLMISHITSLSLQ